MSVRARAPLALLAHRLSSLPTLSQNKIDLVKEDAARQHYAQVRRSMSRERAQCVLCVV